MFSKKHLLYNLNWSCFNNTCTVACVNVNMLCCVTAVHVGLRKIIEKSMISESFVFCPVRLDPRIDARFAANFPTDAVERIHD